MRAPPAEPSATASSDIIARTPVVAVGIVVLLTTVAVLNNMDRVLLAVMAEPIKAEFSLSDTQFGALSGVIFAALYTLGAIPLARLADVYGRSLVLGSCVAFWSVATALTGAATSFVQLALARAAVGLGEAGCTPSVHALIAENVPLRWRGRALSLIGAGAAIGGMTGLWVGGYLAERIGWRHTFMIAGLFGVVVGLLVAVLLRRPRSAPAPVVGPADQTAFLAILRRYGADPVFLLRCAAAVSAVVTITATAAWTAAFAMRAYDLSMSQVGAWLGLGTGLSVLGNLIGGLLVTRTGPRGEVSMRIPAICCLVAGALFIAGYLSHSWPAMVVLFGLAHVLLATWYAPVFTAVQSDAPPHARAQLAAMVLLLTSSLGAGLGPTVVGMISDATADTMGEASLGFALAIASAFASLAGVCMLLADRITTRRAARVAG